jgi:anti-anti-sigma factor
VEPLADLRVKDHEGVAVAVITGEIDLSNAASLQKRIAAGVDPRHHGLVIDLSAVSYLDSAGVFLLFELNDQMTKKGTPMCVVLPNWAPIRKMLGIVRLSATVAVTEDLYQALALIKAGS